MVDGTCIFDALRRAKGEAVKPEMKCFLDLPPFYFSTLRIPVRALFQQQQQQHQQGLDDILRGDNIQINYFRKCLNLSSPILHGHSQGAITPFTDSCTGHAV